MRESSFSIVVGQVVSTVGLRYFNRLVCVLQEGHLFDLRIEVAVTIVSWGPLRKYTIIIIKGNLLILYLLNLITLRKEEYFVWFMNDNSVRKLKICI